MIEALTYTKSINYTKRIIILGVPNIISNLDYQMMWQASMWYSIVNKNGVELEKQKLITNWIKMFVLLFCGLNLV